MKRLEASTPSPQRSVVVPAVDLGLLQAAVALGGGTIIDSRTCGNGDLVVTYVDGITGSPCGPTPHAA